MEEKKNKKRLPIFILIGLLLACAVFSGLLITGVLKLSTVGGKKVDIHTAALAKKASNVTDEMTLRELLLLDLELDITVTEDIEIDETFLVRGDKTLHGDAEIKIDAVGKFKELYVMEVQRNAKLTMDGLTLSGNGMGSGIQVKQRGELIYQSGEMVHIGKGIFANGKVTVNDINMRNISHTGIYSSFKSDVLVNGGTFYNGGRQFINIATGGNVQIDGGTFQLAAGSAITNAGVLVVHDATISDISGNAIYSTGEITTEYEGDKKDGYIEISNTSTSSIYINPSQDTEISDLHITGGNSNAFYFGEVLEGTKVTIDNCLIEGTKGNSISALGNVTIKNTTINDSKSGGIYARGGAKVKLQNVTINNAADRGIRVQGANLTAEKVTITNSGKMGISVNPTKALPGKAKLSEVHISGSQGNNLYMNEETEVYIKDSVLDKSKRTNITLFTGNLTMENVQVLGATDEKIYALSIGKDATVTMQGNSVITGATLRGVQIGENATFNMLGGSICNMKGSTAAAVYVTNYGTFNMKGGEIYGNSAKTGPGAVTVQGVMNMSGGTIRDNESGSYGGAINIGYDKTKGTKGVFNMTGGSIKNNKAATSGGGIHVSNGTKANLSGGSVTGNTSGNYNRSGIHNNGNVTISDRFYMGDNKISLNTTAVVLKIKGSTLKKHSAKEPLLVVPCETTKEGATVVECDSKSAAESLLTNYVSSGVRSFTLHSKENLMTVSHNAADMDMTGADTVYVSTFEELQEAVRSTRTKRYVVVCANIEMQTAITIPSGTTVCIKDDGVKRVLSRSVDNSSEFFVSYYGTGLYLTGTAPGNLVLHGQHASKVEGKTIKSLVHTYGTTDVKNVSFDSNGAATSTHVGAFLFQQGGHISVSDSTFKNGITSLGGGAICSITGTLDVKNSVFESNTAKNGAAIYQDVNSESVTLTDVTFKDNRANNHGGALYIITKHTFTATNCLFGNNTTKKQGGAIYALADSTVDIHDSVFVNNKTESASGGAIYSKAKLTLANSKFENNKAGSVAGAVNSDGGTLAITSCTFIGNASAEGSNGGALSVTGGCVATLDGQGAFESNSGKRGGAIYTNNASLQITGYTFDGNSAQYGGAIFNEAQGEKLTVKDSVFTNNQTTYRDGGAICSNKDMDIINCDFGDITGDDTTGRSGNISANQGGAIWLADNTNVLIESSRFAGNQTKGASGGAVYSTANLTLVETEFVANKAGSAAGAVNCNGGTLTMQACNFTGNAAAEDDHGGALSVTNSVATVEGPGVFKANSALEGGAIYTNNASLTISGYTFDGNNARNGGAVYNQLQGTVLIIRDSLFENNQATYRGGGIYSKKDLEIVNCDFGDITGDGTSGRNGNISKDRGGALWLDTLNNVTVKASRFAGNSSSSASGGAIYSNAKLTLEEVVFVDNNAKSSAGAINCDGIGQLVSKDSDFINNHANGGNSGAIGVTGTSGEVNAVALIEGGIFELNDATNMGGAIYSNNAVLTIKDAEMSGNEAPTGGAIYLQSNVTSTIEESTFRGNKTTTEGGGAIYSKSIALTLNSNIFEQNTSKKQGGAIHAGAGIISVNDCIFTQNSATRYGGAIRVDGGAGATVTGGAFISNTAVLGGGAISEVSAELAVQDCEVRENSVTDTSSGYGGAFHIGGSDDGLPVTLTNITFTNNVTANANKGTLRLKDREVIMTNCKFTGEGTVLHEGSATSEITGDMTGATFIYKEKSASVVIGSAGITSDITITPYSYETDYVVVDGAVEEAKDRIKVTPKSTPNGNWEYIVTAEGRLYTEDSVKEAVIGETYYETLRAALEAAQGVTDATIENPVVITVLQNSSPGETVNVANHVKLTTNENQAVTISRSADATLFKIASGGSLNVDGEITLDGNKENITGTTNFISNAGTFTLGTKAAVKNVVNSTLRALDNTGGVMNLYGTVSDNETGNGVKGAAVRIQGGSLNVVGATFENNKGGYGGAIYIDPNKSATIENATFTNNSAQMGGAVYGDTGSTITINGSSFNKNKSTTTASNGRAGGAIFITTATLTVKDCTFAENTAKKYGTAIYSYKGTANVSDCSFQNETIANEASAAKTIVSGKVTGVTVIYRTKAASVVIGKDGLNAGGDITLQLHKDFKAGDTVLGKANEATSEQLARATEVMKVKQDAGYTPETWLHIDKDGILREGIETDAVTVTTIDGLKNAIAKAGEAATIYILNNMTVSENIAISQNITLKSLSEKVTLTRGSDTTMFSIAEGGSLNVGGNITLDGNKGTITGTTNFISNAGTFTLGTKAAVKNVVNSTLRAINSSKGVVNLYGTVSDNETGSSVKGAAVRIQGGSLNVVGATFENNKGGFGGAIYIDPDKSATIENTTFTNNSAQMGGAVYGDTGSTITINGSNFNKNKSTTTASNGRAGGAIFITTATLTVKDCTFAENTAKKYGTAIYSYKGTANVSDCSFQNETIANEASAAKTIVSGKVTGVTVIYRTKAASVVIGKDGLNAGSDITLQLHDDFKVGDTVLGKANEATSKQLADAANVIKVTREASCIDANGKLASR